MIGSLGQHTAHTSARACKRRVQVHAHSKALTFLTNEVGVHKPRIGRVGLGLLGQLELELELFGVLEFLGLMELLGLLGLLNPLELLEPPDLLGLVRLLELLGQLDVLGLLRLL